MKKLLCAVLAGLMLLSCSPALPEPENETETESVTETAEETGEPIPATVFADADEAMRALLNAEDTELGKAFYTPESYEAFSAVKDEVTAALEGETPLEELGTLYDRLIAAKASLDYVRSNTARVYIISDKRIPREYIDCTVIVVPAADDEENEPFRDECKIKVRGNSTAAGPKFPYNIKLSEKTELLGMDKGKKWALLANLFDPSLIRNTLALGLADDMGIPYVSDFCHVEVFLNGANHGSYLLTESVGVGKTAVDIDIENHDFLLELDRDRKEDGVNYYKTRLGMRFAIEEPEEYSSDDKQCLKDMLNAAEEALLTHDMETYRAYFDVESFVNFYIHSEITKNIDINDYSTRYFIKNGVVTCGPVWDYDLSMGNVSDRKKEEKYALYGNRTGYGTESGDSAEGAWMTMGWIGEMLKDPAFRELAAERFRELLPMFENLYEDNELGQNRIDALMERYGESFRRNYTASRWKDNRAYTDLSRQEPLGFELEVEWLRDWLKRRVANVTEIIEAGLAAAEGE